MFKKSLDRLLVKYYHRARRYVTTSNIKKKFPAEIKNLNVNKKYYGAHNQQRCFVVGNGPSLNRQDVTPLKNEVVFTVNQLVRSPLFQTLQPDYHFYADLAFFEAKNKEVIEMMRSMANLEKDVVCFFPLEAKDFLAETNLGKDLVIEHFEPGYRFDESYTKDFDFTKVVPGFYTVVQYAVAMAIYMGFSEIYLLGCDSTSIMNYVDQVGKESSNEVYAYDISDQEALRMKQHCEDCDVEEVFYSNYMVFKQFALLYKYCEKRDIKLINCSEAGILNNIPQATLKQVLG